MNFFERSRDTRIEQLNAYQVEGGLRIHAAHAQVNVNADQMSLFQLLRPITDASHTRDRKQSPPDSACLPGTRLEVVRNVNTWASSNVTTQMEPHIRWTHGYAGSGKSAISQEVCDKSEREGRPVISFFFFRNAGDRSKIWRLAATLASQMTAVIPETEPLIRAAVTSNPDLLSPCEAGFPIGARVQRLVYAPFKAALHGGSKVKALARGPLLIVLDGLDECDNKHEVQELIDSMLLFFNENPLIPLRVFITSRVEQHIQSRLNVPEVQLDNLVDHCTNDDIATFLQVLFEDGCRRDPVVQAYIQQHGEWPTPSDKRKLVEHIGGSFIFASAVFKFIMGSTSVDGLPTTPVHRLPLALQMNPGLDGLYAQTLARSEHLPHFPHIISTIALLEAPLPTSGIAELLGIDTYEVINVLVNLQAITQVPGTDDMPVTLCHTSLRDFLTTQSRSIRFFAQPSHHVRLFLRCLECKLKLCRRNPGSFHGFEGRTSAVDYALGYSTAHLNRGEGLFELSESNSTVQLCREALGLCPGTPALILALANATWSRAIHTGSLAELKEAIVLYREGLRPESSPHPALSWSLSNLGGALLDCYRHNGTMSNLEEAISLLRQALSLRPAPHRDRFSSLSNLSNALLDRYRRTRIIGDLNEAISLSQEALELRPPPHPDRSLALNNLCHVLLVRYSCKRNMTDHEEVISLCREALELFPSPHPGRTFPLYDLGRALQDRYDRTGNIADLEEAILLYREPLEILPPPHPGRPASLYNLSNALLDRYKLTRTIADLEEVISLHREALKLRPPPHPGRSHSLENLATTLLYRYQRTGAIADLEEAILLCREALKLGPSSHSNCSHAQTLNNLGEALMYRYFHTESVADLDEAVPRLREALALLPSPHPGRPGPLGSLVISLEAMYDEHRELSHLQEAIDHCRELLAYYHGVGHKDRVEWLGLLASLLQMRFEATGQEEDLADIAKLKEEANQLSPPSSPT
ncbi:hypothetical protein EST38_g5166 [Candolleomyces aberdarensis]|uniref:Nephrocystin 3-like N-terminal domain-containing protein n=1 Tax=Candolleomyces aberdarensis TaxID=2316362 RepID=A0A4Q2DPD7_9AGAR|nr:hypothetical protein EST38_g5166 [Candolleomyces aberdarensis]